MRNTARAWEAEAIIPMHWWKKKTLPQLGWQTHLNRSGKAIGLRVEDVTHSFRRLKRITIYFYYCWWETGCKRLFLWIICVYMYVRGRDQWLSFRGPFCDASRHLRKWLYRVYEWGERKREIQLMKAVFYTNTYLSVVVGFSSEILSHCTKVCQKRFFLP